MLRPRWEFPDQIPFLRSLYDGLVKRRWGRTHIENELSRMEPNVRLYARWYLNELRAGRG